MVVYFSKSPKRLSEEDMKYILQQLKCKSVSEIGEVVGGGRWDYILKFHQEKDFTKEDFEAIESKGLTLLLNPQQAEELGKKFNLDKIPVFY